MNTVEWKCMVLWYTMQKASESKIHEYGRTLHAVQIAEFDRAADGETVRLPIEGRVELQKFMQHLRQKCNKKS